MAIKADGSVLIDTRIDTKGVSSGISTVERGFSKLMSAAKKVGAAIAAAFAIRQIVAFSKECIELGSDLEEVQNVVDVTFGKMSSVIDEWAKNAATQFGMSELSAKQYTSTMGAMVKSMGFSTEAATEMSIKMAELTGDMASFYNLDTDTAFQKIRSGISGETEPLKQLGINLSEANLEQFRLSQGMTTAVSKMSQQEKALLRYNYILSVTSDAQGDFARTSGSWANQVRVLRLQFQGIKADLGRGFINLFTPILQVINKLLQGLAKLASAFKAFTNLITGNKGNTSTSTGAGIADTADAYTDAADAAESYADATQDSADATTAAAKANKKYLSGLDQIHRFETEKADTSTGSGSKKKATTTPGSAAANLAPSMDFGSLAQGETVVDKTAQKMKSLFDMILQKTQPAVSALKKLWNEGLAKLRNFTWTALKDFWDLFLVPLGSWTLGTGIPRFIEALNKGLMRIDWERINSAMADLWKKLEPFAEAVGEGLLWFWENVLVPLGTWTMNEVVPRFLTTLSVVISVLMAIIEVAKPYIGWLWENLLTPIAEWTGELFLAAWDKVNAGLTKFSDWCKKNPEFIQEIINLVIAFFAAWAVTKLVGGIMNLISTIGSLFAVIAANPVIAIIGAVVVLLTELWLHWDEVSTWCIDTFNRLKDNVVSTWNGLKAKVILIGTKISNAFTGVWSTIRTAAVDAWNTITTKLTTAWDNIKLWAKTKFDGLKTAVSTTWNLMKINATTMWNNIKTAIGDKVEAIKSAVIIKLEEFRGKVRDKWESFKTNAKTKWESIKTTIVDFVKDIKTKATNWINKFKSGFVGAFNGIKTGIKRPINAIIGFINSMIDGVVNGMNWVIDALNRISFTMPAWMGGYHFGLDIARIEAADWHIPELAKGAVIPPNAPFLAKLGDQKHGTNIEAPLDTIKQALLEAGGSSQPIHIQMYLDGRTVYDTVIRRGKQQQQMGGVNPFELA